MMNYDLFKEQIVNALQIIFEDIKVSVTSVEKNNGVILDGLVFFNPQKNLSPTIYINGYYEQYLDGQKLEDIVDTIARIYRDNLPEKNYDVTFYTDWQKVKNNIAYCLVNYEKNIDLLLNVPHLRFLDFAIVFRYLAKYDINGTATILVKNEHLKSWNIDSDELYDIAMINTPKLLPAEINNIMDILKDMDVIDEDMSESIEREFPMYVLTNQSKLNGSACILYKNILRDLAIKTNSNLYLLPSSIHEVIIIPTSTCDEDIEALKEMVASVNSTMLTAEEILSDNVYLYDSEHDRITIM